jgi:competence protein ComEA
MKEILRDIFSLSALERKGVIVLFIAVVLITCINIFLVVHKPEKELSDNSQLMAEIEIFEKMQGKVTDSITRYIGQILSDSVKREELFFFDPNSVSAEDLRKLGMNIRLVKALINYRSKGGIFSKAEDLKKLYGMDPVLYARIDEFVRIDSISEQKSVSQLKKIKKVAEMLDINQADSALLEKLPGIGPILAKRIIKYRSILGGYYSTQQLQEVYGLTDSIYLIIKSKIFADPAVIKKINLNLADEKALSLHPYIGKFAARGIIQYRMQIDSIKNLNELYYNGLIQKDKLEKLKDYLVF